MPVIRCHLCGEAWQIPLTRFGQIRDSKMKSWKSPARLQTWLHSRWWRLQTNCQTKPPMLWPTCVWFCFLKRYVNAECGCEMANSVRSQVSRARCGGGFSSKKLKLKMSSGLIKLTLHEGCPSYFLLDPRVLKPGGRVNDIGHADSH